MAPADPPFEPGTPAFDAMVAKMKELAAQGWTEAEIGAWAEAIIDEASQETLKEHFGGGELEGRA